MTAVVDGVVCVVKEPRFDVECNQGQYGLDERFLPFFCGCIAQCFKVHRKAFRERVVRDRG